MRITEAPPSSSSLGSLRTLFLFRALRHASFEVFRKSHAKAWLRALLFVGFLFSPRGGGSKALGFLVEDFVGLVPQGLDLMGFGV